MSLSIFYKELDQATIERQTPEWLGDVRMMIDAENPPSDPFSRAVPLPQGSRITFD